MIAESRSRLFLERCGAPSTCEGVVDIFRLTKPKNVIGRNSSQADFYLNSSINKCLISRQHAVILLTQGDSGFVNVTIRDQSLNGTFVNDVKIQGMVQLKVGDTITFGHVNGAGLKPGAHNPQLNSEFRFMLREISDSPSKPTAFTDDSKTFKEPVSPLTTRTGNQLDISPLPTQPSTIRTPSLESSLVSPVTRHLQSTPGSERSKVNIRSGVRVEPQFDEVTSQGRAGMVVEIPAFAKLANSPKTPTSAMGVGRQLTSSTVGARGQQTPTTAGTQLSTSQNICSTPHRKLQGVSPSGLSANVSKPLTYSSPKLHTSLPGPSPTSSRGHQTAVPTHIVYGTSLLAGLGNLQSPKIKEENTKNISKDSGIYDDFKELDGEDPEDMAIDSDGSDDDIFALASVVQAKVDNFTDDDDNFSPVIPDSPSGKDDDPNHNEIGSPILGLDISRGMPSVISEEEKINVGTPYNPVSARSPSPVFEVVTPLGARETQQKVTTRSGGKRKIEKVDVHSKKCKTATKCNKVKGQENPGVEIEICSSIDCCRPLQRKKTAAWVQCDDCDAWYHVDCVGCSYNKVKQSTASFHCGCI